MRLAWPAPRHLIVPLLISIAALAMVHLSPPSLAAFLSLLSLILVFPVPGYLAVLWAYPGKGDLSPKGRAVLSLGASFLVAAVAGLVLWATPRGLHSGSLATLLCLLSLPLIFMAYLRWSDLPRSRRFFPWPRSGLRPGPGASHQRSISGRRAALVSLLAAALFIACVALIFGPHQISWADISSPYHEPISDIKAGKDEPLSTLAGAGLPRVDPAANASAPEAGRSLAQNSSSSLQAISSNATALAAANNTTRSITQASREMSFFRGGGGGGTGSSKETASTSQSEKTASSPAREPEPENAPGSDELEDGNSLIAIGNASNQSFLNSSINQSGNASQNSTPEAGGLASPVATTSPANKSAEPNATSAPAAPSETVQSSDAVAGATASPPPEGEGLPSSPQADGEPANFTAGAIEPALKADSSIESDYNASDSNHPPVLEPLMPDRPSPQPSGTAVFWKAKATDDEGDKIFYKFLVNGQEASRWSRIASWSWLTTGLSPGNYEISVLVRDGNHASESSFDHMASSIFVLLPINQPPALQDLVSDRSSPMELGGSINWTARAVDPDNDTVYYRFLKNGREAAAWSTSSDWRWDTSSEDAGEYVISVLARDGSHATQDSFDSSMERNMVLTLANGVPKIADLQADLPGPQPQGSTVVWTVSALDPEGDTIYYRFMVDNLPAGEWSTSNSWAWDTSSARPGMHTILAQARDEKHAQNSSFDSSKEAGFEISAANQRPILASLLPDIASPQAQGATVTWTAGAADREGDQIFYKFLLDGRDMTGWSASPTWKWSSAGQSMGEHKVTVMVRDGRHAGEGSFDDHMESTFALVSEIDLQIEELQRK